MVDKVSFDADNRLVIVNEGETSLDAEADLYSAAKRTWKNDSTLNKLRPPFRTVAGDPIGDNRVIGAYFFLQNQAGAGWRIRPYEADHELTIFGNLYAEDSYYPMLVPTLGGYTVAIHIEKSSLTQKLISGSGVTEQDKLDIADKVWDEPREAHKIEGTEGETLSHIISVLTDRWVIDKDNSLLHMYSGGQTPLRTFELLDENGEPVDFSDQNAVIYERRPI